MTCNVVEILSFDYRKFGAANILSWINSESEWLAEIKGRDICLGAKPIIFALPFKLNMKQAKLLCEKYRGQMFVIESSEMQEELFSLLAKILGHSDCKEHNHAWTGISDEAVEGNFVNVNNGQTVEYMPFSPGEPNGERKENCAFGFNCKSVWYDTSCGAKYYSFCEIKQNPLLQIRGKYDMIGEQKCMKYTYFM